MEFIVIIPARFGSSRFPGKPLANIFGKSMIQRVYEQSVKAAANVWVATDDGRIVEAVLGFGGNVVMTSDLHRSGTDRCAEAVKNVSAITGKHYDVVINVQGDEPFIYPEQIRLAMRCFEENANTEIATLIQPISKIEEVFNPANAGVGLALLLLPGTWVSPGQWGHDLGMAVWLVALGAAVVQRARRRNAIYFSRAPIPYVAKTDESEWLSKATFYSHVGLYGYRTDILEKLTQLPEGELEKAESLEQLRWIENGFKINTKVTDHDSMGIDTPEDIEKVAAAGYRKFFDAE